MDKAFTEPGRPARSKEKPRRDHFRLNKCLDFTKLSSSEHILCPVPVTPSYRNCIHQLHTSFSGVGAVLQSREIHITEELLCTTCQGGGQQPLISATHDP